MAAAGRGPYGAVAEGEGPRRGAGSPQEAGLFFLIRRLRADSARAARALHLVTADVTEPGTELLALRRILQPSNTDSPPVPRAPRGHRTQAPDRPVRERLVVAVGPAAK